MSITASRATVSFKLNLGNFNHITYELEMTQGDLKEGASKKEALTQATGLELLMLAEADVLEAAFAGAETKINKISKYQDKIQKHVPKVEEL